LICLNIQDGNVLQQHHAFIKKLVDDGVVQGLRIDHIDGLYDPTEYLGRLREMTGDETYIIVEKILEARKTCHSNGLYRAIPVTISWPW
jgi:maltooligosyltrehalose synthase